MEGLASRYFTEKQSLHSYIPFYETLFRPIRGSVQRMLYITCHRDESVQLFSNYFGNAVITVIFTDAKPTSGSANIAVSTEDPLSEKFRTQYQNYFDVIIYDGQQDLTMLQWIAQHYYQLCNHGGILVLESIANAMWLSQIKSQFPNHLQSYVSIVDRRKIQYRPDDILIVLNLHFPSMNYISPGSMMNTSAQQVIRNHRRITPIPSASKPSEINFHQYPTLFHKYLLRIAAPTPPTYQVIVEGECNAPFLCHFHIYDLETMEEFQTVLDRIHRKMPLLITYSEGDPAPLLHLQRLVLLKIPNQGYDIGAKMCALDYLERKQIGYEYILFLHSKSDPIKRAEYYDPLVKSDSRLDLLCTLMEMRKTNLLGIFPNLVWSNQENSDKYIYNERYWQEILTCLSCKNQDRLFAEGNCMVLHRMVLDFIFKSRIHLWYHLLNQGNSFDWNWFRIYYPEHAAISWSDAYQLYQSQSLYGNNHPIKSTANSIPDGMFEHVFERIWINVIKHLHGNYLLLDRQNLMDQYQIRINAIYFPQFHEIPENNKFWGDGFTEWTLLRPYPDQITVNNIEYPVLKPHPDLGYYDLSKEATLPQQIEMAQAYGIHGFLVYHYWFQNNHKILYKPLERFLSPEITYPFAISWANETWSRRWDGSNNEILLAQEYGTADDYRIHIQYLIPFFQRPNYMRTIKGECIFYIYNFADLQSHYPVMMAVWKEELSKVNLTIKIVVTENSFQRNHNLQVNDAANFIFEPMYSTNYVEREETNRAAPVNRNNFDFDFYLEKHPDIRRTFGDNREMIFNHFLEYGDRENRIFKYNDIVVQNNYIYDYTKIAAKYLERDYMTDGKHLGLPLYWNNIVRRKGVPFLIVENFDLHQLQRMVHLLIATILLRPTTQDNIININAWNEWNEQAVLEPSTAFGYDILRTIHAITSSL